MDQDYEGFESFSGMFDVTVQIKYLDHYAGDGPLLKATTGSAGFDLVAANSEPILLNKMGASAIVPLGFQLELPYGFEAQVRARSGLASKYGITMANGIGTIDSDYRGEVCAILLNTSNNKYSVLRGTRVAQLVIAPIFRVNFVQANELDETDRGSGGFGSTGT